MRSLRRVLIGLAGLASTSAFARGGPGGAIGAMLEALLMLTIVGGLVTGGLSVRWLARPPWRFLGLSVLLTLVLAFVVPILGPLLGVPVLVFLAVFASVSYLARPDDVPTDGADLQAAARWTWRDGAQWLAASYLFWVVVSLFSFELLVFLAVPPLLAIFPQFLARFWPFIWPPLVLALVVAGVVTGVAGRWLGLNRRWAPMLFNTCLLVAFFVSADAYRGWLMARDLATHQPRHVVSRSFLSSVWGYSEYGRGTHATFEENGKFYYWSYAERRFVAVP